MSNILFKRPIDTVDRDGNPKQDLPKVDGYYFTNNGQSFFQAYLNMIYSKSVN